MLFLMLGANSVLAMDCCTPHQCAQQSSIAGDSGSNYTCDGAEATCAYDSSPSISSDGVYTYAGWVGSGTCSSVSGSTSPGGSGTIGIPEKCDVGVAPTKLPDDCGTSAPAGSRFTANTTCDLTVDNQENCGFCCMMNVIYKVTTWLFYILMLLVTVFIIYGGFIIITASGDPEKAGKGRQILTYAIIGLAIALLARVIPSLVRFIIGV